MLNEINEAKQIIREELKMIFEKTIFYKIIDTSNLPVSQSKLLSDLKGRYNIIDGESKGYKNSILVSVGDLRDVLRTIERKMNIPIKDISVSKELTQISQ